MPSLSSYAEDLAAMAAIYLSHTESMIEDPETTGLPIMRRRRLAATILECVETPQRNRELRGLIEDLADAIREQEDECDV